MGKLAKTISIISGKKDIVGLVDDYPIEIPSVEANTKPFTELLLGDLLHCSKDQLDVENIDVGGRRRPNSVRYTLFRCVGENLIQQRNIGNEYQTKAMLSREAWCLVHCRLSTASR
jgi:hypothetical protein